MTSFTDQLRRIDDANLDPYQFRLLMHYWRVGNCWESLRKTADKCGMSLGQVSKTRQWLLDNGWIEWATVKGKAAIVLCSLHEQIQQLERSPDEQCSPHEHGRSPHEQKPVANVHHVNAILNEPKELNEPNEEEEGETPKPPADNPFPFKPSPVKPAAISPAEERVRALLEVCNLDPGIPDHVRQAENTAAQLGKNGKYTPEYLRKRYAYQEQPNGTWYWYRDDWRGQKGQMPKPKEVLETVAIELKPAAEKAGKNKQPPPGLPVIVSDGRGW